MSNKDKKRYRVRDGYHFQYVTEVIDGQGNKHNFAKRKPAPPGEVIEVPELQTRGQEHKLELAEAVVIQCNNGPCGLKFVTKVPNIAYAFCPHCGGRGGDILGAEGDVDPDPVEEKPEDKDRMLRARDKVREDEPEEDAPQVAESGEAVAVGDHEPALDPKRKKKVAKKKRKRG